MAGVKYAMARTRPEWLERKTGNFLKFLLKPDLTFFDTGVVLILRSVILPGTATVSLVGVAWYPVLNSTYSKT